MRQIHSELKVARRAVSVGVGLTALVLSVLVTISVGPAQGAVASPGGVISVVAQGIANPRGITAGPDGNLWFTNAANSTIGRVELLRGTHFDFNGDGTADRGVYRNGSWIISGQTTSYLGLGTDTPVPADYDGDGIADKAVYRTGAWITQGQPTVYFGTATDKPVPADYDGDGTDERMIYRNGGWLSPTTTPVYFGLPTDKPLSLPIALR